MRRYSDGEVGRVSPTVLYLCDGKVPRCSGSFYCLTECKHTTHVEHAKNFTKSKEAYCLYWENDIKEESDEHGKQMGTEN